MNHPKSQHNYFNDRYFTENTYNSQQYTFNNTWSTGFIIFINVIIDIIRISSR